MSWQPEVKVAGEGDKFYSNGLRFATRKKAEDNAADLASRWTLVKAWRVVESSDPVNYQWLDDALVKVTEPSNTV